MGIQIVKPIFKKEKIMGCHNEMYSSTGQVVYTSGDLDVSFGQSVLIDASFLTKEKMKLSKKEGVYLLLQTKEEIVNNIVEVVASEINNHFNYIPLKIINDYITFIRNLTGEWFIYQYSYINICEDGIISTLEFPQANKVICKKCKIYNKIRKGKKITKIEQEFFEVGFPMDGYTLFDYLPTA